MRPHSLIHLRLLLLLSLAILSHTARSHEFTEPSIPLMLLSPGNNGIAHQLFSSPDPTASESPHGTTTLAFQDMFPSSGLQPGSPTFGLKFGGPCVADIDGDGHYDIILNYHNLNHSRIYFSNGDSTFSLYRPGEPFGGAFSPRVLDVHGIAVAPISTRTRDRLVTFSVGGGRGSRQRAPEIYRITPQRGIREVTNDMGLGQITSRPRNVVFMDLAGDSNQDRVRNGGGPDALFMNFLIPFMAPGQFAYRNRQGQYQAVTNIGDIALQNRGRVEVTDVDSDMKMEVISIPTLQIFQVQGAFQLNEITRNVLPPGLTVAPVTVAAVAEFDFDNDGDFDLYVARTNRSLISRLPAVEGVNQFPDLLLRNDGGIYVDVSVEAGIPRGTNSVGVSVGDFDNDGWVDVLVVLHEEKDIILRNLGDGTFERKDGLIPKREGDIGNSAVAVDYDQDGHVDAIVGHGGVNMNRFGPYYLLRNVMTGSGNFLHVTVYNDRTGAATCLHAVVTVFLPRRRKMVQRVGSRGSQDSLGTLLDTVHFGLGDLTSVAAVAVRWTSRLREVQRDVDANQRIFFGVRAP
eukprot:GFKZ01005548.1.p1 GENE.GFKZ01005548.1~~GFKZ01005548.1.p1  ORF type:complete len:573 (+),score=55.15 GFKZ01005548.1:701-2419(+)